MAVALPFLLPRQENRTAPVPGEGGAAAPAPAPAIAWMPVAILVAAASLRSMVIFGSISFLPTYLAEGGLGLLMANTLLTVMLLVGVGGQVLGGAVSDRSGRKETILAGMVATAVFLAGFLLLPGAFGLLSLMLFGFSLWSSFSVTLAISHELLPGNLGLASGLLLGLSMGAGGVGVALIGALGDAVGLGLALWTLLATLLFLVLPYPWRRKEASRDAARGT
jgi:FSR family fosmidomycin resistance protein-like MFS transporter